MHRVCDVYGRHECGPRLRGVTGLQPTAGRSRRTHPVTSLADFSTAVAREAVAADVREASFGVTDLSNGPRSANDVCLSVPIQPAARPADLKRHRRAVVLFDDALVADAERLPLPDRSVDTVSMAFGLRNCTDKDAVLAEARRVLTPGGRFCCLEFSRVQVSALVPVYDAWSFKVLPRLGQLIAGDADSYQYLAESIRMFPDQETLAGMMANAGLSRVKVQNLSGGIAAIHTGWRL